MAHIKDWADAEHLKVKMTFYYERISLLQHHLLISEQIVLSVFGSNV